MEKSSFLNYDQIASEYNQRYPSSQTWDRGQALLNLAGQIHARTALEVGSGTGFWLNLLHTKVPDLFGLDYSLGMIHEAQRQPAPMNLLRGSSLQLPYLNETFDLVYCVDAIHHFGDYKRFISESYRVLKPGGALAVIGHDPHEGTSNWYIYEYFDGVLDMDLRRYPSGRSVTDAMQAVGYDHVLVQTVEHILNVHVGDAVLRDPFLKKNATSQLALLSEDEYMTGMKKIEQAVSRASSRQEKMVFSSDIRVQMYQGHKL